MVAEYLCVRAGIANPMRGGDIVTGMLLHDAIVSRYASKDHCNKAYLYGDRTNQARSASRIAGAIVEKMEGGAA
jgi:hypothetical protein